jgi:hypothetical protein
VNNKFLLYAVVVTALTTGTSWVKMLKAATNTGSGSSWSSHSGGYYGGSGYSGGGGGGHK